MTRYRLYHDLAPYWALISPREDYAAEAACIRKLIDRYRPGPRGPDRLQLLELGAGAGHHVSHLDPHFDVTAVDLSRDMVDLSRQLNPDVEHVVGDMRSLRLGRRFDVVLAQDAIDYMTSETDLAATFATAAAHLEPGGMFITAPNYTTEDFVDDHVEHDARDNGAVHVDYVTCVHRPHRRASTFDLVISLRITEAGRTRTEEDRHTCGLFPLQTWLDLLNAAGFDVHRHRLDETTPPPPPPPEENQHASTSWLPEPPAPPVFVAVKRPN